MKIKKVLFVVDLVYRKDLFLAFFYHLVSIEEKKASIELSLLENPRVTTKTFGKGALLYPAPYTWNSLPVYIIQPKHITIFKKAAKTHSFPNQTFLRMLLRLILLRISIAKHWRTFIAILTVI